MSVEQTKDRCRLIRDKLRNVNQLLEDYLNHTHLGILLDEEPGGEEQEMYLKEFLSDLRHLSVSCELRYEKVSLLLRRAHFNEESAERILKEMVHTSIHHFFYPKNEVYEEDSRCSYTNRDPIQFRGNPPSSLKRLVIRLSAIFVELREELECYEQDTHTRIQWQGARLSTS
ncbi:DUF3907 family protein [Desmospora profundinema]|uniref:Adenylate kinase family enzyme n=1 Tax=Desmospora profundinema TaxID=1571184 RepID=A0ABU1IRI8_9BACL|nr:DUF3907 family protein [Desmospora profundinema]MDR6227416.1 adenylate kinase family enzyme [Desmospora profundinema]